MKPNDIEIGQKYTHIDYPDMVYLGCGYLAESRKEPNKQLVIVECYDSHYVGAFVTFKGQNFINGFKPLTS